MPAELFRTVAVRRRSTARRLGAVPLSIVFHAALLVAVVTIPLVATTDELPTPHVPTVLQLPSTPVVVVPKVPPASGHARLELPDQPVAPLVAPMGIPQDVGIDRMAAQIPDLPLGEVPGIIGVGQALSARELPPPPPPVKATGPLKPGGDIAMPRKIHHVAPVYPPMAASARVEGTVVIEAIISTTGTVQDARVVNSVPLLDAAALEAVRQWVFTPTRLNNVPVPVILTVKVEFKLR
jgi:protein TonB